jgi:hypothetical protein
MKKFPYYCEKIYRYAPIPFFITGRNPDTVKGFIF